MGRAKRIHHIGVAVRDIAASVTAIKRLGLGLEVNHEETIEQYGVRLAVLPSGDSAIELVQPIREGSRIGSWMSLNGQGLHHVCIEVDGIDAVLLDLKERGVGLLDQTARPGHHGSRIAFVDPAETPGLLIELLEASH